MRGLPSTMFDVNTTLQKLSGQFQSLREEIKATKRKKSKKGRKSSRHSRSRVRRHCSRRKTRSNSPQRGKDPTLEVEKDTLLVPPVPGAGLRLKVDDHAPQIRCRALEVEQATDRDPRVGATRNHQVGATHDYETGIILVPEAEQGTLDLRVDHPTQYQRLELGKTGLTTQTTMKQ